MHLFLGTSIYDASDLEDALQTGFFALEEAITSTIPISGRALTAVLGRQTLQRGVFSMQAIAGRSLQAAFETMSLRRIRSLELWNVMAASGADMTFLGSSLNVQELILQNAVELRRAHLEALLSRCGAVRCYGANRVEECDREGLVAAYGPERIRFL